MTGEDTYIIELVVPQIEHFQLNEPIHAVRECRQGILTQCQDFEID